MGRSVDGERANVKICVLSVCFPVVGWIEFIVAVLAVGVFTSALIFYVTQALEQRWPATSINVDAFVTPALVLISVGVFVAMIEGGVMEFIFENWKIFLIPPLAIATVFVIRLGREHTRKMELAAARLGLRFQKKDPDLPLRALSRLRKGWGWSPRMRNVAKGEVDGCKVILLEYTYAEGWGAETASINQTVGVFRVVGLNFPAFSLEARPAKRKSFKFDSHPQFSMNYRLTGADEIAIRQLFGSEVLEFFQHARGESVECDGEWMIIYRSGHRVGPDELKGFLGETIRTLDVFRSRS